MADIVSILQVSGIIVEMLITGFGVAIGLRSKSSIGWLIGSSFFLYAVYDFIKLDVNFTFWAAIPPIAVAILFLASAIFTLIAVFKLYNALD